MQHVLHLDVHSGQGKWGRFILAANHDEGTDRTTWMRGVYGNAIEAWDPKATLYTIRGGLGRWCAARFPTVAYDELTAEFGTYATLRVVQALRDEFDQLFSRVASDWDGKWLSTEFRPACDASETADAYQVRMDVPGMKPDDITVQVTGDSIRKASSSR